MERSEVLDLAVDYIKDVKMLVRCCLASKRAQSRCKCHVQQHLPTLLTSAHAAVCEDHCNRSSCSEDVHSKPFEWLYHTAGRQAVSSPEVAMALLCVPTYLRTQMVQMAVEHGMLLSAAVVVAASKTRARLSKRFLRQVMPGASLPATIQAVLFCDLDALKPLLLQLTPHQMSDLLHIAVNTFPSYRRACPALMLLEHDKQHAHTLHGEVGSSSSTDSNSRSLLAEQLLTTSIIRGHYAATQKLAATAAAQALNTAAVLRLLYLSVEKDEEVKALMSLGGKAGDMVTAVSEIPAARLVDAAKLGSLLHFAMTLQRTITVVPRMLPHLVLLKALPQAQQLPPNQVYKLLLLAVSRANGEENSPSRDLLRRLAALPSAKQLASGDAFRLVRAAMQDNCGRPGACITGLVLQDLRGMDLGSQLTGSELLQLLVMSTKIRDVCRSLADLQAAADLIDDEAGYVEFLEQAMSELDIDEINSITIKISLTQRLAPTSAIRLFQKCLSGISQGYVEEVSPFLLVLPALQRISANALGQLLLQAALEGTAHSAVELLAVPAAAQLSTTWVKVLLQAILAHSRCNNDLPVVPRVLALPAAGMLSAADIAELLLLAICLQWRVQQQQPMVLCSNCSTATVVQKLLELPAAVQLAEQSVIQLLEAAITANDGKLVSQLCSLSATQFISEAAARQLYQLALDQADANVLHTLLGQVPQILAVAAAVKPAAKQLEQQMQLLRAAIAAKDTELLSRICALSGMQNVNEEVAMKLYQSALLDDRADPAILRTLQQQLPQVAALANTEEEQMQKAVIASLVEVLTSALECGDSDIIARHAYMHDMLKSPAAVQVRPEAMQQLMQEAFELLDDAAASGEECPQRLMLERLLSRLAGLQQLDVSSCEDLLQEGLQGMHSCKHSLKSIRVFMCFVQLPAMQALTTGAVARLMLRGMQLGVQRPVLQMLHCWLPAAQQLSCNDVRALLLAEAQDKLSFTWLRGFPRAPADDEVQAWWAVLGMPSS